MAPDPNPRPLTRRRRNIFWRMRRVLFVLVLLFILGLSVAGYMFTRVELPPSTPPLLETTFICAGDITTGCDASNAMGRLSSTENRVIVGYDELPQVLIDAVVAAEDRDFFQHSGVDPWGIVRAVWANARSEDSDDIQGGSTITQQYVKNVYLTTERTFDRKLKEAAMAIKLEQELPKAEILNRYLNVIYFGRGAYGVQAASRAYFGKDIGDLELHQAAYLAALIRTPEATDAGLPAANPNAQAQRALATERRGNVLDAMLAEALITPTQHSAASAKGWEDVLERAPTGNYGRVLGAELGTEYFLDYVKHSLVTSGRFTEEQLFGGGLRVYTTLDLQAQALAVEAIASTLDAPEDPAAALVSIDDQGRVIAMVGGTDYSASKVNLAVGTEGGGTGRQPGSSIKPIILAEAVSQGVSLSSVFEAPSKMVFPKLDSGADWTVTNYADAEQGQLDLVAATTKSSNTAYAQLILAIGPDNAAALAKKMGIKATVEPVPSMVLGAPSVSVLDMATAYSTLANEGELVPPHVVTKVTDARGTVLWESPVERQRVLDTQVAKTVSWTLSQVIQAGTGTGANFGRPAAGKTGTTDEYRDAWFVGFTCSMTTAVWMGYPGVEAEYMTNVHGTRVTGGSFPATIWRKYMAQATEGRESCPFERPADTGTTLTPPSTTTTTEDPSSTTTTTTTPGGSSTTTPPPSTSTPPTTGPPPTTDPPPTTTEPDDDDGGFGPGFPFD